MSGDTCPDKCWFAVMVRSGSDVAVPLGRDWRTCNFAVDLEQRREGGALN